MNNRLTTFYSPIQFEKYADIFINTTIFDTPALKFFTNDVLLTKNKLIIFLWQHNISINYIIENINCITVPFVIISALEDNAFPYELNTRHIETIINHPQCKHWFTINCTLEKYDPSKITPIPYGLDYWTLQNKPYFGLPILSDYEQDNILNQIATNAYHFSKRIPMIYANFHFNITDTRHGSYRKKLKDIIPSDIIYYQPSAVDRTQTWNNTTKYTFVVSPAGNGLDCIRTFESLVLGCIVIVHKNTLNLDMYDDLPVYVVNDYSEINKELLENILIEFSQRTFNYKKLTMDYWHQQIQSKLK